MHEAIRLAAGRRRVRRMRQLERTQATEAETQAQAQPEPIRPPSDQTAKDSFVVAAPDRPKPSATKRSSGPLVPRS